MQRQSLGSPGSRHAGAAGNGEKSAAVPAVADEESKRTSLHSPSSLLISGMDTDDEEKIKLLKPHHRASPAALKRKQPEKLIHAIPVLTFVCFLILYLASSDPSQSDLDQFTGLKRPEMLTDAANASRFIDMNSKSGSGGDVVEIRSLRNLREIQKLKSRFHRKFGHL